MDGSPEDTLPKLLARHLSSRPDETAVVVLTPHGELTLSVAQLLAGSAGDAARYEQAGV